MDQHQIEYQNTQDIKNIVLDNYKYSTRRYDVVCLVFTGFGLYANYELFKSINELNAGTTLLFISTLILLILAFINLYVLRVESAVQGFALAHLMNSKNETPETVKRNGEKIDQQEKSQELKRGLIYMGLVVTTVLTLVGFVVLS
jgi:hypothetical protein